MSRSDLIAAKASWHDVLLVCKKCLRRQRHDADISGEPLPDWIKRELKASEAAGAPRTRLLKSSCFDLCPEHGVVLALGSQLATEKPLRVLRNGDDPSLLRGWLKRRGG